jgi:hypothetical protein
MMGSDHCVSVIVLTLTVFHCFTFAITPADARDDAPASLQLDSAPLDLQVSLYDGSIVVSAGMELFLLDPNLTVSSSVMVHDRIPGQRIALPHNSNDSVLVCKEEFCSHYDVDWMYDEEIYEFVSPVARGFDSVPLSVEPTGFYIATSDGRSIDIKQLDENGNPMRDYNWAFNNNQFYQRQFLEGFQYGDFIYFVARDNGTSELANKVRVIRLCHGFTMRAFSAAYEAILECGEMSANSKVEVSSSLLDEFGNPMITFAVTTDEDTNICSFSLDNINAEMDASYTWCSSNENSSLIIPLAWYNERTCGIFSSSVEDQCDFKLANEIRAIPALATFESIPGQHHLRLNESEEITAVLAVRVGSYADLIFVAYTTSSEEYFLDKYHITGNGTLELVLREPQSQPVTFLRWNAIMEEIYIANANSVFQVPLESCSNYTTCGECTSSKDPLCGWCTLEQYCSRDIDCPRHLDKGHWVAGQEQCIVSVSLAIDSMDVDLIQNVDLTINPQEATLPSSPAGGYQCSFYHTSHENVSYAFTTPFTGGACQLQESDIDDFVGKRIDLSFALQIPNQPTELFPSTAVLALHNCSLHTECAECVGASSACGWCVHDRICTGNPSKCRHTDDWRSRADSEESSVSAVCPMVLTPDHGSYTLPVAVRRELILSTLNIPPEIPGYQYGCQMKYGNGTVLPLMSEYHNHTYFRCVITENQVRLHKATYFIFRRVYTGTQHFSKQQSYTVSASYVSNH